MSTYKVSLRLPAVWKIGGVETTRSDWVSEISQDLGPTFVGTVEGTAIPEIQTLDIAEAPSNRDLVRNLEWSDVIFYFQTSDSAQRFGNSISSDLPSNIAPRFDIEKETDWNLRWKEEFRGAKISPDWMILPSFKMGEPLENRRLTPLYINPGMGFGSGEHSTTALCLSAIGKLGDLTGRRVLDFGSGSGILAIAAALNGAEVDAVEIDDAALENARDSIRLNRVENRITLSRELKAVRGYDVIVANILSPVLLEFAGALVDRMNPKATLILSGLLREHVDEVLLAYRPLLNSPSIALEYEGEWASIHFKVWNSPTYRPITADSRPSRVGNNELRIPSTRS